MHIKHHNLHQFGEENIQHLRKDITKKILFVDGRYTIQAQKEAGKNFKIVDYRKIVNCNLFKNLTLGIDPKIFTVIVTNASGC